MDLNIKKLVYSQTVCNFQYPKINQFIAIFYVSRFSKIFKPYYL